jgi:SAM-dependent methyltransferase
MHADVPLSNEIAHSKWIYELKRLCDIKNNEILEVGSRVVTGSNYRGFFEKANYTGFDLYEGPNVDIAGDAHRLSSYFNKKFDLIFSSAVFEHLAMPWIAAEEIMKLLKPNGYIFVETHYSYSSHERPWHFFQFSEQALKSLFPESSGIKCIQAGVSNPMIGYFSENANEYLRGKPITGLYCHSEFLGQKVSECNGLKWCHDEIMQEFGLYPPKK